MNNIGKAVLKKPRFTILKQSFTDHKNIISHIKQNQQLEGHSVERMYLQQRLSDASANKTILKPWLAPKTTPPIRVRGIFPT